MARWVNRDVYLNVLYLVARILLAGLIYWFVLYLGLSQSAPNYFLANMAQYFAVDLLLLLFSATHGYRI
jgi:hypothetical protein